MVVIKDLHPGAEKGVFADGYLSKAADDRAIVEVDPAADVQLAGISGGDGHPPVALHPVAQRHPGAAVQPQPEFSVQQDAAAKLQSPAAEPFFPLQAAAVMQAAPFFPQPAGRTLPQPHTPAPDFGALEALAPAVCLVVAVPAALIVVDAEGARGPVHPLGHIIKGGKAVGGQHQKAVQLLLLVFLLQTGLGKQRGIPLGAGAQIRLAGLLNKSGIAVARQHFADHLAARLCAHAGAGIHQQRAAVGRGRTVLHADKALVLQQFIQRAHQLHVRIQINAAVPVQHRQPHIVRHKGIFLCFVGLLRVAVLADLKVLLVPHHDLVIRAVFFPAFDTFTALRADGPAAEPAVVDDLGDAHGCSFFFSANFPVFTTLFYKNARFLVKFPSAFFCAFPQKDCRPAARCGILGADGFVFPNHSLKIHSFFQFLL